ncbi:DUF4892 domain-containing protein [Marinobacter sp. BW6]|uniref:DUF4892 domain-containing protein n=1 Tax=Marinobacter sp. BW6 TaxID=2592624 RepID=UPI0011DE8539|nr:DUF4892 domain-containing protein [Marinobacter sp. BW6]TYC62660.1 DUF4892 domain-containing protein [Marinobacter sp. BW6]
MLKSLFTRFLIPTLGLLAFTSVVQSAPEDVPAAFEQSTLEDTVSIRSSGHLVLFSPVREVNNEIRSESRARLPVNGEGRLYRIAQDSSREEARDHYRGLLRQRNAQILFECSSIRCGRSNVWANQIFNQAVLYGRDATQDYLVAGTVAEDGSRWLTLIYTVTRGNLREYVWVEHLRVESGATIPGFGTVANRVEGPIIVPWQGGVTYRFDWQATDRRRVSDLAREEGTVVALVGYSVLQTDESFSGAMERARRAAESLSEVLSKTGVSPDQQKIIVVGPAGVFGDPDRQGDRVEVVVISR